MIRYRLKEMIAEYEFRHKRRLTMGDIARATGVHRATLSKMANQHDANLTIDSLDSLCEFFNCGLGDLVERFPGLPDRVHQRISKKTKGQAEGE